MTSVSDVKLHCTDTLHCGYYFVGSTWKWKDQLCSVFLLFGRRRRAEPFFTGVGEGVVFETDFIRIKSNLDKLKYLLLKNLRPYLYFSLYFRELRQQVSETWFKLLSDTYLNWFFDFSPLTAIKSQRRSVVEKRTKWVFIFINCWYLITLITERTLSSRFKQRWSLREEQFACCLFLFYWSTDPLTISLKLKVLPFLSVSWIWPHWMQVRQTMFKTHFCLILCLCLCCRYMVCDQLYRQFWWLNEISNLQPTM